MMQGTHTGRSFWQVILKVACKLKKCGHFCSRQYVSAVYSINPVTEFSLKSEGNIEVVMSNNNLCFSQLSNAKLLIKNWNKSQPCKKRNK